jgi:hypothetical protein
MINWVIAFRIRSFVLTSAATAVCILSLTVGGRIVAGYTQHDIIQQMPRSLNEVPVKFAVVKKFGFRASAMNCYYCRNTFQSPLVLNAAKGKKQLEAELPSNEFSRTFQVDRVIKTRRGSGGSSSNVYPLSIEADESEREALALRFDLSSIANLSAVLQLRPSILKTGGVDSNSVEVEGSCKATVTQRCVRTNEDFEVDLEFPLYCIVRPVISHAMSQESSLLGMHQDSQNDNAEVSLRKQAGGGASKKTYRIPDKNIGEVDVMELQRMLQFDLNNDDNIMMEDEAIYCLDGPLDVGELVAQFFWFKLDPYPKKPGTDPVQISITG